MSQERDREDWLEWVRPERPDPDAQPNARQAAALAADPALRADLARRTLFDDAVAAVVREVPVPADLTARLSARRVAPPARGKWGRRAFAATAALALLAAAGWWQFGPERSWTPVRVAHAARAFHTGAEPFAAEDLQAVVRMLPSRFDAAFVVGGGPATLLGRAAYVVKLQRGEQTATLTLLRPRLFPRGFDFDAYVPFEAGEPEAVFLGLDGLVCVAVAHDLQAFARSNAAL